MACLHPLPGKSDALVSATTFTQDANGCWIWNGRVDAAGFPVITVDGKRRRVQHTLFILLHGRRPAHGKVGQACGNQRCVNPDHANTLLTNGHDSHTVM